VPRPGRPADSEAITVAATATAAARTPPQAAARGNESRAGGALRDRIGRGDRVYVVRAGDSLWSVAADRLGAGAGVAAIAREVNRLWERNRDRIATGDPDVLRVGTRLTLR
jgi:nucleoid-associated protein YgaU